MSAQVQEKTKVVSARNRFAFLQPFLPPRIDDYALAVRVVSARGFDDLSEADRQVLLNAEAAIYELAGDYREDQQGPRFQPGAVFGP